MKRITKLEPYGSRIKVYIEDKAECILYKGEVRKFCLTENMEISEFLYDEIMNVLYQRAKERALYILENSYQTTKQIQDKLKRGLYPENIIDRVIEFLTEYHFVDDYQYTMMYIEYKAKSKSIRQITQELFKKGVSKEIVKEALEKSEVSDKLSLKKMIDKKITKYNIHDKKELNKFYQYLVGRGYSYGDVKDAMEMYIDLE